MSSTSETSWAVRAALAAVVLAAAAAAQRVVVEGPSPGVVAVGETARIVLVAEDVPAGAGLVLGPLPILHDVRFSTRRPEELYRRFERDGRTVDVRCLAWNVDVRPLRSGTLRLGPFTIVGAGTTLAAGSLTLEVMRPVIDAVPVRLRVTADRDECFVGESLRLALEVLYDPLFMREEAVQPFRSRLDVPLQVTARMLEEVPGAEVEVVESGGPLSTAVNGEFVELTAGEAAEVGDRRWERVRIECDVTPQRAGFLDLGEPVVRVIHARGFAEDFFGRRRPSNQEVVVVGCESPRIRVRAIPQLGRPVDFGGALGVFTLEASTRVTAVTAGESVSVAVRVTGTGDLATVTAPRLESSSGLHVLGVLDRGVAADARTFVYDLAIRDAHVSAIPAFTLASFDPATRRFVTAGSHPLPVEVRGATVTAGAAASVPTAGVDDVWVDLEGGRGDPAALSAGRVAAGAALPWLLLAAWLLSRRRAAELRRDPLGHRARRAAAAFRRRIARGADPGEALLDYLAARLRRPRAAVVTFDIDALLLVEGVPVDVARRAGRAVFTHAAGRFGVGFSPARDAVFALVSAIEDSFTADDHG